MSSTNEVPEEQFHQLFLQVLYLRSHTKGCMQPNLVASLGALSRARTLVGREPHPA